MESLERKRKAKPYILADILNFPNLNGIFMIAPHDKNCNSEITQETYDEQINQMDVHHLECTCHCHDMVIHGYYTRKVRNNNDSTNPKRSG